MYHASGVTPQATARSVSRRVASSPWATMQPISVAYESVPVSRREAHRAVDLARPESERNPARKKLPSAASGTVPPVKRASSRAKEPGSSSSRAQGPELLACSLLPSRADTQELGRLRGQGGRRARLGYLPVFQLPVRMESRSAQPSFCGERVSFSPSSFHLYEEGLSSAQNAPSPM